MTATHGPESARRRGCGIFVLLCLIAAAVVVIVATQPIRDAKRTEQLVNDRLEDAPAFGPPATERALPWVPALSG